MVWERRMRAERDLEQHYLVIKKYWSSMNGVMSLVGVHPLYILRPVLLSEELGVG